MSTSNPNAEIEFLEKQLRYPNDAKEPQLGEIRAMIDLYKEMSDSAADETILQITSAQIREKIEDLTLPEIPSELLDTAKNAAVKAGREIMRVRESGIIGETTKVDGSIVTIADQRSQAIILSEFSPLGTTFLMEEDASQLDDLNKKNSGSPYKVIVDPLDGTRAFKSGTDDFCVSIAVTEKNRPIVASIFIPTKNILISAQKGKGAYLIDQNGNQVIRLRTIDSGLSPFKFSMNPRELLKGGYDEEFKKLGFNDFDLEKIKKGDMTPPDDRLVLHTSTAMVYVDVARGNADCAMSLTIAHKPEKDGSPGKKEGRVTYDWDLAAADLIISEAGGYVTDINGKKIQYGGRPNPGLHDHVFASHSVKKHFELLRKITTSIDYNKIYSTNLNS